MLGDYMKLSEYYIYLVKYNLNRLKKENKWTVTKMSQLFNISESHLFHFLSMKSTKCPSIEILGLICDRLHITIDYFFKEQKKDKK